MIAFLRMLGGAALGALLSLALYILGFGAELVNCACQIITCNCNDEDLIPGMWSGDAFLHVLLFCTIGGAIIGLIYGIYRTKAIAKEEAAKKDAENAENARKQRVQWAGEVKQKALDVKVACNRNKSSDKPLVSTTYEASSQMSVIIDELTTAAELQGKVDSLAEEIAKKGGAVE